MAYDTGKNTESIRQNLMNLFRLISDYIISDYAEIETGAGNNKSGKFISITGSGGKTSLIKGFSRFLGALGKSVLITTSVKIQSPCCYDWGTGFFTESFEQAELMCSFGRVVVYGKKFQGKQFYGSQSGVCEKWCSPPESDFEALKRCYDVILCEADGAKGYPLKIHTERDPVIYACSDKTVSVMGMWAYGMKVEDAVFGYKGRYGGNTVIDYDFFQNYIDNPDGVLKSLNNDDLVLLNGCEKGSLIYELSSKLDFKGRGVIFGSINDSTGVLRDR